MLFNGRVFYNTKRVATAQDCPGIVCMHRLSNHFAILVVTATQRTITSCDQCTTHVLFYDDVTTGSFTNAKHENRWD
jgi:hypothetical protein